MADANTDVACKEAVEQGVSLPVSRNQAQALIFDVLMLPHRNRVRECIRAMQVSKWLGHASWRVTMAIYADWIPEEEIANTLPEPVAAPTNNVVRMFG